MRLTVKIAVGFAALFFLFMANVGINHHFSNAVEKETGQLDIYNRAASEVQLLKERLAMMEAASFAGQATADSAWRKRFYYNSVLFQEVLEAGIIAPDTTEKYRLALYRIGDLAERWRFVEVAPMLNKHASSATSSAMTPNSRQALYRAQSATADSIRAELTAYEKMIRNDILARTFKVSSSIYGAGKISLILAGFLLLIGMGMAFVIWRNIRRSVANMVTAAEKVAAGNFDHQMPEDEPHEMGRLARALNRMMRALSRSFRALEQSNRELNRANKDLEQFAFLTSHDLKEPVRMVSIYTQLLENRFGDQLGEEGREYTRFATEGAHRIIHQLNDLQEYVRITQETIHCNRVDLRQSLNKVLGGLDSMLQAHQAEVKLELDYGSEVWADEAQLENLFRNLIDNSVKFKSEESPRVIIRTEPKEDLIQISVQDNGIGIDEQYRERIFSIFQRLHGRTEYGGTGIGLTVCKKIVELHGGSIWFESEPGQGTSFFFTLPRVH